jgi:DNA-binding MarR family transcriptional regulator
VTHPDWLDEREQRAWRGFIALNAEIQRRLGRQLQLETGLTMAEYAVLASLSEAPGGRLRVFELRAAADWEKTRLTHQITRMTARGLVAREPCPDDPRGAFVVLTEAGWTAIMEAAPRHVAHVRHWFFDSLAPGQVETLIDVSRSVLDRLPEADRAMGAACPPGEAACPGPELAGDRAGPIGADPCLTATGGDDEDPCLVDPAAADGDAACLPGDQVAAPSRGRVSSTGQVLF